MHRCTHMVLGAHIKCIHLRPSPGIQTCQQPRAGYQINHMSSSLSYYTHKYHIHHRRHHVPQHSQSLQGRKLLWVLNPQSYASQDTTTMRLKPSSLTHHKIQLHVVGLKLQSYASQSQANFHHHAMKHIKNAITLTALT